MEDLALTVPEVMQATKIGRNEIYRAIANKELRVIRVGRRVIVPVAAVQEWLTDRMAASVG